MNKMELHDVLRKVLAEDEPDVLRELMKVFLEALMGAEARCGLRRRVRRAHTGARELPQRLPPPATWTAVWARSTWLCPSCGPAATFPSGCWRTADVPSVR